MGMIEHWARRCALLVAFVSAPALAAPPTGTLDGVVTQEGLATPLPNVQVTLRSYTPAPLIVRHTDEEGHFRIIDLPPGLYRLEAKRPGFERMVVDPIVVPAHVARNEHVSLRRAEGEPKPTT